MGVQLGQLAAPHIDGHVGVRERFGDGLRDPVAGRRLLGGIGGRERPGHRAAIERTEARRALIEPTTSTTGTIRTRPLVSRSGNRFANMRQAEIPGFAVPASPPTTFTTGPGAAAEISMSGISADGCSGTAIARTDRSAVMSQTARFSPCEQFKSIGSFRSEDTSLMHISRPRSRSIESAVPHLRWTTPSQGSAPSAQI